MDYGMGALAVLAILCLWMSMAAFEKGRQGERERARIEKKIDLVEQNVSRCCDELQTLDLRHNARISQLERKVKNMEAPDPFETILDKEEDEL